MGICESTTKVGSKSPSEQTSVKLPQTARLAAESLLEDPKLARVSIGNDAGILEAVAGIPGASEFLLAVARKDRAAVVATSFFESVHDAKFFDTLADAVGVASALVAPGDGVVLQEVRPDLTVSVLALKWRDGRLVGALRKSPGNTFAQSLVDRGASPITTTFSATNKLPSQPADWWKGANLVLPERHPQEGLAALKQGCPTLEGSRDVSAAVEVVRSSWNASISDDARHMPALALAYGSRKAGTVGWGVSGERKRGSGDLVSKNDVWLIASCIKPFTGITFGAVCIDNGPLTLDSTLEAAWQMSGTLAEKARKVNVASITMKELLAHNSGLPRDFPQNAIRKSLTMEEGQARRQLFEEWIMGLASPIERKHSYSNMGYIALGSLVERYGPDRDFFAHINEKVLRPAGVTSAFPQAPPLDDASTPIAPYGHAMKGNDLVPLHYAADNPPLFMPSGRIYMSVQDFACTSSAALAFMGGESRCEVSPGTAAEVYRHVFRNHDGSNTSTRASVRYDFDKELFFIALVNNGPGSDVLEHSVKACRRLAAALDGDRMG